MSTIEMKKANRTELVLDDMSEVTGGCNTVFGMNKVYHTRRPVNTVTVDMGGTCRYSCIKYKCDVCGEITYERLDLNTGAATIITEGDYNRVVRMLENN